MMDFSKVKTEGDLMKLAQSFYILSRLKSTKTHHAKKVLPFEEIDFSIYEEKSMMLGFKTTRHRLCAWAYALLWHHVINPQSQLKADVRLLDNKGKDVAPEDQGLYKMQIHVNKGETTMVSIHLYFTCASIHVQGKSFKTWGTESFQKVKDTVDEVATNIKKARDGTSAEAAVHNKSSVNVHRMTVVENETSLNLKSAPEPTNKKPEDISLSDSSKLSVAGALLSPQASSTPASKPLSERDNGKSPVSKLNTSKDKFLNQANDLRRKSNEVITQLDGSVADLISRVGALENTNSNKLSNIENLLKEVMSKQDQINTRLDNMPSANVKSTDDTVKKIQSEHSKTSQNVTTIMQKVATVTEDMNSLKTDIQKLQSDHNKTFQNVNTTMQNVLTVTQDVNSIKTDIAALKVPPANIPPHAPPPPPLPKATTTPADKKQPAEPKAENDGAKANDGFITVTNGVPNRKPDRDPPVINPETDTLVMADSMFSMMTDTMLKPHKTQIAAYGGLDTEEMTNILGKVKKCETVKNVLLHVGYKDSKNGPIPDVTEQSVSKMIKVASQSFPKASVYVTSVLPARKNKNRVNVDSYNLTIKSACDENNALYVDLTPCAIGQSGKVNDNLFRDPVHPNGNLTKNIAAKFLTILPVIQTASHDSVGEDDQYVTITDDEADNISQDGTPQDRIPQDGSPIIKSTPVFEEKGNKFQAHYVEIHSREEQRKALVAINAKAPDATHNTVAYTFDRPNKHPSKENIDDGEYKAGRVMMDAIEDYKGKDCIVVVSRWFAGHMGPRRFQIYYNLTAAALGHNPLQNRPYPNRYPQIPSYSSQQTQWNTSRRNIPDLMSMGYPQYVPQYSPPDWFQKPQLTQPFTNSYGSGPWTPPVGNSGQYNGQRYTYYNGKRIMVQI